MDHSELVCVKEAKGKGRGVFARKLIRKGEMIERTPVFLVPFREIAAGRKNPNLAHYFYLWNRTHCAITLGYGSIYNHSYEPNAQYRHGKMAMTYYALRDIAAGEEITINYNGDPADRSPMIFDVVEGRRARKRSRGRVRKSSEPEA
jgi:SET domain-containing protein